MKFSHAFRGAAIVAALTFCSAAAHAAPVFVGSWQVDQGPAWGDPVPAAYSGQEAAALLFGGNAADYVISTVDNLATDINDMAWVSTWGGAASCSSFPCGTQVAQDFVQSTGGLYQTPGDTSAYVTDWAIGEQYTNYAFLAGGVPEPTTWAISLLGLFGLGAALRSQRKAVLAS